MGIIQSYDLLVVGAGPAGSSAAAEAASRGAATLLIDSKTRIGEPPHCGEFVPAMLFADTGLDRGSVVQRVQSLETRVVAPASHPGSTHDSPAFAGPTEDHPDGEEFGRLDSVVRVSTVPSPGFIIDRVRFDRDLAREAAVRGATVLCATRLVRREQDAWILKGREGEVPVRARLVIAADGPLSAVAAAMGMPRQECLRGLQVEAPLTRPWDRCMVVLDPDFVGGYGWVFPKGSCANVGLGVVAEPGIHAASLLDAFVERLIAAGVLRPGRLALTAGLIPVSGLRPTLVRDRVMFCGDAAGLTHPITGAGIPQAVLSGRLAGQLAAEALRIGNEKPLMEYDREIKKWYKGVMGHARSKRQVMMQKWYDADFADTCEQTWIAFKGYRTRVTAP